MSMAQRFLAQAVELACENVRKGGRPFGAVVVINDAVIAEGVNQVVSTRDPTAHAELLAIRAASRALGTPIPSRKRSFRLPPRADISGIWRVR